MALLYFEDFPPGEVAEYGDRLVTAESIKGAPLTPYPTRIGAEKRLGFSGCCAFYPPHVGLINAAFTPSEVEVAHAHEVIELYEAAVADGKPAVQLSSGEALLMHQYKEAQTTLARAR